MTLKPLLGLLGVLLAALTVEFNDGVVGSALIDVRGGLGISSDPGTWLTSLFSSGQVIGMSIATFWAVTVSIRRFALFAIALSAASTLCIPLTSNLALLYGLRFVEGARVGLHHPAAADGGVAGAAAADQALWPGRLCPDRDVRAERVRGAGGAVDRPRRLAVRLLRGPAALHPGARCWSGTAWSRSRRSTIASASSTGAARCWPPRASAR